MITLKQKEMGRLTTHILTDGREIGYPKVKYRNSKRMGLAGELIRNPKQCGIYKITSPDGKVYVGKSKDLYTRYFIHKNTQSNGNRRLYESFKKFGTSLHIFNIIEICLEQDLSIREKFHIQNLESTGDNGLNCSYGGEKGSIPSSYTRSLMSVSQTGVHIVVYLNMNTGIFYFGMKQLLKSINNRHTEAKTYHRIARKTSEFISTGRISKLDYNSIESLRKWS